MNGIKFSRHWAMPNHETFQVKPIAEFVHKYLSQSKVSVDPFARNSNLATYRNDLNPNTTAEYHLECDFFLAVLKEKGITADLIIVDPPYSPRQVKECYDSIGVKMTQGDALLGEIRKKRKQAIIGILAPDGIVLSFGWNTVGMGKQLGFEIMEIMLVCHGSDHNDTICMAERRLPTPSSARCELPLPPC